MTRSLKSELLYPGAGREALLRRVCHRAGRHPNPVSDVRSSAMVRRVGQQDPGMADAERCHLQN